MRFTFFAALFVCLCASLAQAEGPDRLSVHLGSSHVNAEEDFEEFNPGLFVSWDRSLLSYTVGAFRNSYGDFSVAATVAYPLIRRDIYRLTAFVGWAHYPENGRKFRVSHGDVVPVAGLRLHYRSLFVQFLPGDGSVADAVFSFGFSVPLRSP